MKEFLPSIKTHSKDDSKGFNMAAFTLLVIFVITMLSSLGSALEHDDYRGTLSKLQKSRRQFQEDGAYGQTYIIELRDETFIRGKIITQTLENHVVIESIDGKLDVLSMNDVNEITSTNQTIELKDGVMIRGKIIEPKPGEHVVLKTLNGKLFVRSMKDIKEITPETQTLASSAGPKNPGLAFGLSLIHPGMGQYYNEQYGKGTIFLVANWCALLVMQFADNDNNNFVTIFSTGPSKDNRALGAVGFIGYAVIRLSAAFDARASAKDINVKHKSFNALRRIKPLDSRSDLGVAVSWKF